MIKFKKEKEIKKIFPISYYENIIEDKTSILINLLKDFPISQSIIKFLENPCKDCIYQEQEYFETIEELKAIKSLNDDMFISFLGVTNNDDCIDNFGHSRLLRKKEEVDSEDYSLIKRPWYIEALEVKETMSLSTPYLAESGSYVISVLRKVYNKNKELIGILGIDVLFSSLAQLKNGDNIIIFMKDGRILYNSAPKLKYVIEKQDNMLYMVDYLTFNTMISDKSGILNGTFCSSFQEIEFTKLFDDRFILLKTEKV